MTVKRSTNAALKPIIVKIGSPLHAFSVSLLNNSSDNLERIRRVLVETANYDDALFTTEYRFGHRKSVALAGFAFRPLDARSICVGVVPKSARLTKLDDYRELGSPLLLRESEHDFELWRVGANADRDSKIVGDLSITGISNYFQSNCEELQPHRIYEAKTYARVQRPSEEPSLFSSYVDPELLPFVEQTSGDLLTQAVVDSIRALVEKFGAERWTIEVVFRLLAGKILRDKNVPGFKSVVLSDTEDILRRVEKHYGSQSPLRLNRTQAKALTEVMQRIQELGDFSNLTTEALGDVYEKALITRDIRRIHGTHKTPSYLVDYIVWQIAKWIDRIPVDELRFFEPGCGHAPFLVSAMRMLRAAEIDVPDLSKFFRERFVGFDNDPFALEIARLSLTLADEPNTNGWVKLSNTDMYADGCLEAAAANATVMLTNPPYEQRKAEELLYRTLPNLPAGAIFAAVVPATVLLSDKPRAIELRSWMASNCQLAEIDMFPDGLFTFADHECAVVIGRRLNRTAENTQAFQSRLRSVFDNEQSRRCFQNDYSFGNSRVYPQSKFGEFAEHPLWVPEFYDEVWQYCHKFNCLGDFAKVNQGLQHLGRDRPTGLKIVSNTNFPDAKVGFTSSVGDWAIHDTPETSFLNLSTAAIRRPGTGTDCVPQVLLNYHPVSREYWRLKPFIDFEGRAFQSNFLSIRPINDRETLPLAYLWALLVSPIANLYAKTHLLKRNIVPRVLKRMPVPSASDLQVKLVCEAAERYRELADKDEKSMFNNDGYTQESLSDALIDLDAEVLRLYQLPVYSERLLLDQFRGESRPGIPVPFREHYAPETSLVPLYAYRSQAFQRHLRGGSPELSAKELSRYDDLTAKANFDSLTARETERLYRLQAEVDGRDYASNVVQHEPIVAPNTDQDFAKRLMRLSERAANLRLEQSRK